MPTIRLTDATVKALRPRADGERETYWDDGGAPGGVRGLVVRVAPDGRKSFSIWTRVRGTRKAVRVTLGEFVPGVFGLADAREAARKELHKAAIGEDPAAARRRSRTAGTFGKLVETFLKQAEMRPTTRSQWEYLLRHDRLKALRARKPTDITRGDLVRVFDKIREESVRAGGKGYSANRTLEAVRRVFNWGVQKDQADASPCVGIVKPTREQARRRAYSDAELGAIVRALREDGGAMADACLLALYTGVRIAQALGAPWSEVNLDKKEWLVSGERAGTKNGLPWLVPLSRPAVELLRRRQTDSPFVFAVRRRKGEKDEDGRAWRQQRAVYSVREKSGVGDFTPHDFRRTLNSWLASTVGGARSLEVRDAILGHRPRGLESVYNVHGYAKEKRTALDRWAAHVERVASKEPATVVQMPVRA